MARRGGPTRLLTGNPLGGMLRDLDRRSRSTTRRSGTSRPAEPEQPREGRVTALPPPPSLPVASRPRTAATVVVAGEDGRARWTFPVPFSGPPVLTALPVDPAPEDEERTATVALEEVTPTHAVVRVWRTRARRGSGVASPAGDGVRVHLVAYELGE